MTDSRRNRFASPPHSARSQTKPRSFRTLSPAVKLRSSLPDLESAPEELRQLRLLLSSTNRDIHELKDKWQSDVSQLRQEVQSLRQEVDLLRFERDEAVARQSDTERGDVGLFARQIAAMRGELDKLGASCRQYSTQNYDRARRT